LDDGDVVAAEDFEAGVFSVEGVEALGELVEAVAGGDGGEVEAWPGVADFDADCIVVGESRYEDCAAVRLRGDSIFDGIFDEVLDGQGWDLGFGEGGGGDFDGGVQFFAEADAFDVEITLDESEFLAEGDEGVGSCGMRALMELRVLNRKWGWIQDSRERRRVSAASLRVRSSDNSFSWSWCSMLCTRVRSEA
jgi:hypothetical protein